VPGTLKNELNLVTESCSLFPMHRPLFCSVPFCRSNGQGGSQHADLRRVFSWDPSNSAGHRPSRGAVRTGFHSLGLNRILGVFG
jgi:hypothetical protein